MAKDGTNRGGRRVRAGAKPDALGDKLAKGSPATRLHDPLEDAYDFTGSDVGDGAVLAGEVMPEPSDYLSEVQRVHRTPKVGVIFICVSSQGGLVHES